MIRRAVVLVVFSGFVAGCGPGHRDVAAGVARPAALAPSSPVEARVRKIVAEHLGVSPEKVTANADFVRDLGADNLDQVELVMAFEEAFDIEIPDDAAEHMRTVGDAEAYIEAHAKAGTTTAPPR
jgi:acyl carrier protein